MNGLPEDKLPEVKLPTESTRVTIDDVRGHHSPLFKIDPEPSVRLGTGAMTVAVLDLLKPGASRAAGN